MPQQETLIGPSAAGAGSWAGMQLTGPRVLLSSGMPRRGFPVAVPSGGSRAVR